MAIIVASTDNYLGGKLADMAREVGARPLRSASIDRLRQELKKPGCTAILDLNWEDIQEPGVLRQLVNLGRITGSTIFCICPNDDEGLKKLAKSSGCTEWFIRYDLETRVRDSIREALLKPVS